MKRIILIAIMLMAAVAANAQIASAPRYRELKNTYNHYEYVQTENDPYSVIWAEVFSFFVPGSSQLVMREPVRGLIFLGSTFVCSQVVSSSVDDLTKILTTDSEGNLAFTDEARAIKDFKWMAGAGLAALGVAIWSSIDAKRVAKVKNLYFQDITSGKKPVKFNVDPYLSYTPTANSVAPVAGLSLNLSF